MVTITRKFEFEAAHKLPYHKGKCGNLHGHSYKLEITLGGSMNYVDGDPSYGMLIDFSDFDRIVKKVLEEGYDHTILNNTYFNPTVEHMVEVIPGELMEAFDSEGFSNIEVVRVDLWETSNSYATWTKD